MTGAAPASQGGRQIWRLLPEHYRTRDNGDLAGYVDALGEVLDLLRALIQQRFADSFPDHPDLQPWVLPYLADLIDTRVVSADETRRRAEIANAALWRKTKGTLRTVEQVAEVLGGFGWSDGAPAGRPRHPVLVQEGFRRVAITPRLPIATPAESVADRRKLIADASLPMGTVDFRAYSRRVVRGADTAAVQANPHGVPCFPGSSEDLASRTPDLRAASARGGLAHPSRVLIFCVPHPGFFPPGWELGPAPSGDAHGKRGGVSVGSLEIDQADGALYTLEDCIVDGTLRVKRGGVRLVRCAVRRLVVDAASFRGDPPRSADAPVVTASDSLFESVQSAGLAQLTFCTVLKGFEAPRAWTSDTIFAGSFAVPKPGEPWHKTAPGQYDGTPEDALRYSRLPAAALAIERAGAPDGPRLDFRAHRCTSDPALFASAVFGSAGCGVLAPEASPALAAGAEDGGELGAYHHRGYSVGTRAVLEKLRDYLPVGQVAAVLPDPKLSHPPPALKR